MWPLCWVCVCVRAGQKIPLCVLARNPNKGLKLEISRETESGRGEEGPRKEIRSVGEGRRGWQQSAEGGRRRWKQGREGSQQKSERRLLRTDDLQRGRVNLREMSAWLVAFVEISRKIHARDCLQMHGECKVSQNTLSCAWNWPKSILFVCSSFHLFGFIFCGRKEMWNTPAETTTWFTGHE